MSILILYGSYLAFPFLGMLIYLTFKQKKALRQKSWLINVILLYVMTLTFIYARFVERYLIVVHQTTIETGFEGRIILIADMHLGLYKSPSFLERVVAEINAQKNINAVLIAGDFTYIPPNDLEQLLIPLKKVKAPVYAVLGNHDSEHPGPPIEKKLQATLELNGVNFLSNEAKTIPNTSIKVLGLGDNWAQEDDISKIEDFNIEDNLIVLTHNPDTTLAYQNAIPDISLAGHTHGGQIRIPFIYKYAIPCTGDFDQGLYQTPTGKVFVTSGLGEVGLPIRFLIPPVIDILEFH